MHARTKCQGRRDTAQFETAGLQDVALIILLLFSMLSFLWLVMTARKNHGLSTQEQLKCAAVLVAPERSPVPTT